MEPIIFWLPPFAC